jgi:hypothetical protein
MTAPFVSSVAIARRRENADVVATKFVDFGGRRDG